MLRWRTCASTSARRRTTPRSARSWPRSARRTNDAFGTAHCAHASTAGVAALLPAYAGYLMQQRGTPGMLGGAALPLRRHPRRLEGVGQERSSTRSWTRATRSSSAAGCAFTFFGAGQAGGHRQGRGRVERGGHDREGRGSRREAAAAGRRRAPTACRRCRNAHGLGRRDPCGDMMGLDIGPETAKLYATPWPRPRPCSGTPHGRVRDGRVRGRHEGRGRRRGRQRGRGHHHRRRRQRGRRQQVRPGRADDVHLHRRRRLHGARAGRRRRRLPDGDGLFR